MNCNVPAWGEEIKTHDAKPVPFQLHFISWASFSFVGLLSFVGSTLFRWLHFLSLASLSAIGGLFTSLSLGSLSSFIGFLPYLVSFFRLWPVSFLMWGGSMFDLLVFV